MNGFVYIYINKINNKKYIGITNDVERRYKEHLTHNNQLIDKKIKEYGIENFIFKILFEGEYEECKEKEKFYIKEYKTLAKEYGYNIVEGGDGCVGFNHSEETKQKISESMKKRFENKENHPNYRRKMSEKQKESLREYHTGMTMSDETKQKISDKLKNRIFSDEHKRKISESMKGENNPNYGKPICQGISKNYARGEKHHTYEKQFFIAIKLNNPSIFKVYKTTNEIIEDGFDRSTVNKCILGKRKQVKGYKWLRMTKDEYSCSVYFEN